ncbi:hypothetical protein [Sabulicella rubraurantiaca]|uniref:hypothetical protein n=1 Tax=Sabulicella rubraurantiaca TaxID=2811429 RepID=UPI001A962816|nr:hypothetical protein [Sabulicella rubraurantiaca]
MQDETVAVDLVITDRDGKHRLHAKEQPVLRLPDGRFAMEVDGHVREVALLTLNFGPAVRCPPFAHLDERLWADSPPSGDDPVTLHLPPEGLARASWDEVDSEFEESGESFPLSLDILEAWVDADGEDDDIFADVPPPRVFRYGQES